MKLTHLLLLAIGLVSVSGTYHCDGPGQKSTVCVKSSWIGWKSDRAKFQNVCKGNLVRWGDDSGVQDCGVACLGCSYIRACCDECTHVVKVEGSYKDLGYSAVERTHKVVVGVSVAESHSWTRTEEWSQSVSTTMSASGTIQGIGGSVGLTAEFRHSLSITKAQSWSETKSVTTTETYTQPAETNAWGFQFKITDTCGIRMATSNDFVLTPNGNPPCCMPGMTDHKTAKCIPDNAGNVVDLCGREAVTRYSPTISRNLRQQSAPAVGAA